MNEIIRVENLTFAYRRGEYLFKDLSFSVYRGDFFCIVGPNGAGKTTLLKIILGLIKAQSGRILVNSKRVGYVPQRISVERFFTGTPAELFRAVAPKQKVGWIISFLHLENVLHRPYVKLSGGEQQKVLLSIAFLKDPDLLILDEPTTGLDIHAQEHVEEFLRTARKDKTLVVVSHDLGFVVRNATKVLCLGMQECRLVEPQDLKTMLVDIYGLH
ncbi:metal ABC transporter ATP-binding protein [Thermocrinis minervae]|uniref:Zinc transport system ATP-binding protein n=1 Tax=Thermocrinis minervae TaxID=381751 RepID=A0A1M6S2U1_9AQUI|nr:metal ABC transporter ATP-binding protein [Thermocrinis minervae]SHK38818.1 zinc transport system ATP-binding protein [Thermocrinis minervae]